MLTLSIERSTRHAGWSLCRDTTCLFATVTDTEPARAPAWLAELGAALDEAGVPLATIDRFVAGLGPGSFSGIRAAVAALQGMALPGGTPLLGVSSAAALAFTLLTERAASGHHTPVSVVGDARRERLWCGSYTLHHGQLRSCTVAGIRHLTHDADDFQLTTVAELPNHLPPGTWVVTPDWQRIGPRLAALLPAQQLLPAERLPTALDVSQLYLAEPDAARKEPVPIYLQPAVAEARA
jgi:tRNA threonylcarbamoyl adenosine modification protein YeaZ